MWIESGISWLGGTEYFQIVHRNRNRTTVLRSRISPGNIRFDNSILLVWMFRRGGFASVARKRKKKKKRRRALGEWGCVQKSKQESGTWITAGSTFLCKKKKKKRKKTNGGCVGSRKEEGMECNVRWTFVALQSGVRAKLAWFVLDCHRIIAGVVKFSSAAVIPERLGCADAESSRSYGVI